MAMAVLAAAEVAHAAAAIGGGVGGGAPLEVAGKEEEPLVEGVPAAEGDDKGAARKWRRHRRRSLGRRSMKVHWRSLGMREPPAEGAPLAVEADGKGAAAPVEGAPGAIKAYGIGENKVEAEEEKWLNHYSSMHSILIVGDGDFSFSLALATAFGSGANLFATSLDSYEVVRRKYSKAESNIMELKRLGATVLHGVDAKTMMLHTDLKNIRFDRIVFNFPHAGFKGKEDDLRMINSHKELMRNFFRNAHRLLRRYGEIHVTHKTGDPYDKWDLERLASKFSLVLVMKVGFQKLDYPGYNQKRGDGARCDKPFDLANACTFMFQIGDLKKMKKMNRNRARSTSNLGGSNVHPGQWAVDAGPFHALPPVEAWPAQPGQWASDRGPFHPLPPIEAWPPLHFPPPVNTDHTPLHPYITDERQQRGFPLNSDGIMGAPYFHEHDDTFCPTPRMPWPSLPAIGGIPPPVRRISYPNLLPPPEQPWYETRTISDPPDSDDCSYFARQYQRSLQREYDMGRHHLMPGSTSLNYSAFLEHRRMESVKKQEWLRRMIALYSRQ